MYLRTERRGGLLELCSSIDVGVVGWGYRGGGYTMGSLDAYCCIGEAEEVRHCELTDCLASSTTSV